MKKIIVIIVFNFLIFNNVAFAAVDCTDPKKMSEKLKCKITGLKKDNKNDDGKEKKFKFKNPFKKLNDWGKRNKTLTDIVK